MTKLFSPSDFEITDGYIGALGLTWKTATDETLYDAIQKAAERHKLTEDEIIIHLANGKAVDWRNSPNYYYDHNAGYIRRKRHITETSLVSCDCGHDVPPAQIMIASLGSSCPDCYDIMSN